ncbi:unnamed protein product [Linum trigynum]|uniref:Uncharacterized protein n=1 Tax=Linum trigynum TaxID=586398 RepID=A0AAV2E1Y7_9ROSI
MAAETILIPLAKQILGKAADLALEQIGLLWNFRRELRKLKGTVSRIQAVLRDAEKKQFHNHQVKDWLEKLSDVMYDADDLLDDLATEARRNALLAAAVADDDTSGRSRTSATTCWSLVCFLFASLPQQLWYDLKMAHAIKDIREKLDDISNDKETLDLEVHTIEEEGLPSRETDSCPPTIVVGREDDKKNIIQLLLNSNRETNISVVPIVGMGGLGKTTLAQLVFDDDQVKAHFDINAWVYVSLSFDVKVILGKMLRSIDRQIQGGFELDDLQAQLREKIRGKRFLFVLDDVWEETSYSWETLGKYLTIGALGSKVLVTTRSTKVAEVGGGALKSETNASIVEPYLLKSLSEEECWNLLVKKALPRKVPRDPQVREIGNQILRKCDGVPLAVSTIAGALVDSSDPKTDWPSFLQKGLWSIIKEGEEDPTMSALLLSFNHLPSYMKHCFTYCTLFPKGLELPIKLLVQFWVAQGYVESEDKGFDCFRTLWWRSFFQEVQMDELGNISLCRMHDLMHDLADSIAAGKIVRSSSSTILKSIPSKTRHLLILDNNSDDVGVEDYGDMQRDARKVRTLICGKSLSNKELEEVIHNFLHLRVLVVAEKHSNSNGEESSIFDASTLLSSLDKLKHLRYLALQCAGRKKLSNSVTNLVNLQVLKLTNVWLLEELPRDTKMLVNLKHLEVIGYEGARLPNWLSGLINLVEFLVKDCKQCEYLPLLHRMSSLKKLKIEGCPLLKGIDNDGDHFKSSTYNITTRSLIVEEEYCDWPRFPCLDYLCIKDCTMLTQLPMSTVEGELELENVSLAPLARVLKMRRGGGGGGVDYSDGYAYDDTNIHPLLPASSTYSSVLIHPLSKMTRLTLCKIDDDLESLPHLDLSSYLISLRQLRVLRCSQGVKLPGSLCSSICLTEILLYECRTIEYLPPLHELPCLRVLSIEYCRELKGCWWKKKKGNNDDDDDGDDSHYYNFDPSKDIDGEDNGGEETEEWPHFPRLSRLAVTECPKLTRMPLFPTIEGELRLQFTSTQALVRTMKMKPVVDHHYLDSPQHSTSSSMSASLVPPLSKLKHLFLVATDLESLPEEGLRNLTFLEKLSIYWCQSLACLPPAMQHLTSLQSLSIWDLAQLLERCEEEDWPNISHIPYIQLNGKTLQGPSSGFLS